MKTKATKISEVKRDWHFVDADDQILGRMATGIAKFLMGKDKPYFVKYLDCGDYVVVVNAKNVKVTGRKASLKVYPRHSGYPGGFKEIPFEKQLKKDPTQIIRHAVSGMLPKNKQRDKRLSRLKVFADEKHPYEDKFKNGSKKEK